MVMLYIILGYTVPSMLPPLIPQAKLQIAEIMGL